jgi:S-adenosylmethionine hydrolase
MRSTHLFSLADQGALKMKSTSVITLTTDFGLRDSYVAEMKGVILKSNPSVRIVDITHEIAPQDVDEAAWIIERAYRHFPPHSIHIVVVDPGVGTDRAVLGMETGAAIFLAPDNGVLKMVFHNHDGAEVVRIRVPSNVSKKASHTFHGRDIFAPAAGALSTGVTLSSIGDPFTGFVKGKVPRLQKNDCSVTGEIVFVDRFGNGMTNIMATDIERTEKTRVVVGKRDSLPLMKTYSDVAEGEPLAYIGSYGTIEIAVRNGNARDSLAFDKGDRITVGW